nr:ATP-binding cassette domain-containing protein [Mobiluncus mulieris]
METEAASPVQQLRLSGVDCNRGANVLIRDVNLTLEPGTITGLIGPNGAGKSTLIATMLGDIAPARVVLPMGANQYVVWRIAPRCLGWSPRRMACRRR